LLASDADCENVKSRIGEATDPAFLCFVGRKEVNTCLPQQVLMVMTLAISVDKKTPYNTHLID